MSRALTRWAVLALVLVVVSGCAVRRPGTPVTSPGVPPTSADAEDWVPPTSADAGVPPTSADSRVPPTSADSRVPPTSADAEVPPTSADAGVPPTSADAEVPPTSAPVQPATPPESTEACPLCGDPSSPKVRAAYAAALAEAKIPTPEKVSRDLLALVPWNSDLRWDDKGRILMSTWTKLEFYSDTDTYSRGKIFSLFGETWLTAVPAMRDFCRDLGLDGERLVQRLEQRLGLPPDDGKDAFLEIWVDPTDIFRACPDPEISDHECQVEIAVVDRNNQRPWDCTLSRQVSGRFVTVHPGHLRWMCDNWTSSYASKSSYENYPWTALGYTYDWGDPDNAEGESEFVALGGSEVVFESLTPTELYCLE